MMLKPRWMLAVWPALLLMTASCAVSLPPSAEPPRLILPGVATTPCVLERLPGTGVRRQTAGWARRDSCGTSA